MRQLLLGLAALVTIGASNVPAANAQVLNNICNDTPNASVCVENKDTRNQTTNNNRIFGPDSVLIKIAGLLAMVVGIISVIMIIVGGLKYVLSSGDSARINSAKNTILYAVVGLVVALLARSIILLVINNAL